MSIATAFYSHSLHLDAVWVNFGSFGSEPHGSSGFQVSKCDPIAMLVNVEIMINEQIVIMCTANVRVILKSALRFNLRVCNFKNFSWG